MEMQTLEQRFNQAVAILDRENTPEEYETAISAIKEVADLISKPVIVHPMQVYPLPENIKTRINEERLKQALQANGAKIIEATDFEALFYISTCNLVAPLDHDAYKIMVHLFCKCFPHHKDIFEGENTELESYLQYRLKQLKEWLHKSQLKGLKKGGKKR